ncbi:bacteriohemerythrin [Methylomonas sp. MgM2]
MRLVEILPWNEAFETGLPEIDIQHKKLVRLINQLAQEWSSLVEVERLNLVLEELEAYASYHFQTEEAIWHRYLSEDAWEKSHKEAHQSFTNKIMQLKSQETSKPLDAVIEDVLKFLTHWLLYHILDSDMRMAKVVLLLKSGSTIAQAKEQSDRLMRGAAKDLIFSVLAIYQNLTHQSLHLAREIIRRQKAEAKLRLSAKAIANTLDAICITDAETNIIEVNPSFIEETGYDADQLIGRRLTDIKTGFQSADIADQIWYTVQQSGHWSGEINNINQNSEWVSEWLTLSAVKNEQGQIDNYVAVFSDISYLIKKHRELDYIAHHDALTGIPNRILLIDRIKQAIAKAKRNQKKMALCYLDLDDFKPINDSLGHGAGDAALVEIAKRISETIRDTDTVARIGGDEFVILLLDLEDKEESVSTLTRLQSAISKPIVIQTKSFVVGASIGISLFPDNTQNAETLLTQADQAMYIAKHTGKNNYCFFSPVLAKS